MLNAFSYLLCSKVCWHNRPVPTSDQQDTYGSYIKQLHGQQKQEGQWGHDPIIFKIVIFVKENHFSLVKCSPYFQQLPLPVYNYVTDMTKFNVQLHRSYYKIEHEGFHSMKKLLMKSLSLVNLTMRGMTDDRNNSIGYYYYYRCIIQLAVIKLYVMKSCMLAYLDLIQDACSVEQRYGDFQIRVYIILYSQLLFCCVIGKVNCTSQ